MADDSHFILAKIHLKLQDVIVSSPSPSCSAVTSAVSHYV